MSRPGGRERPFARPAEGGRDPKGSASPPGGKAPARGGEVASRLFPPARADARESRGSPCVWVRSVSMILPQVHLRKPCYDFSFL